MRVFVASGHYDRATPITTADYEAGHMMHIDAAELAKLKTDVSAFLQSALMKH